MPPKRTQNFPGEYPVQRKKIEDSKKQVTTVTGEGFTNKIRNSSLGLKPNAISKIKSYFHHKEYQHENYNTSKWSNFWSHKKHQKVIQHQNTSNTVAIGTIFSLSVPITISTTQCYSEQETTRTTKQNPLVQQLVILPSSQIYGFLFLATLFLIVSAFALLQVHRTISIIETAVEGVKHVLVSSTSNFLSLLSRLKSCWF